MQDSVNAFIDKIYREGTVQSESGAILPLHSAISADESEFIGSLIAKHKCTTAIEVGCAYGLSSLRIAASVLDVSASGTHTIIDPYQRTQWLNTGIANLNRAGLRNYTAIEAPSETALPEQLSQGRQFDFAFIDGWHTFDQVMLDFYYLNRMLKPGGLMVFDDVTYPSINACLRYIMNYPCYRLEGTVKTRYALKRRILMNAKLALSYAANIVPYKRHLFAQDLLKPDQHIGLQSSMVALIKTREDQRPFDWYVHF